MNQSISSDADDGWSRDELQASVEAYVDMQHKVRNGESFIKKRYYEDLASKFGRSEKAFEYRMQNISYVLSLMGRQWLTGLRPMTNVGARIAEIVEELLNDTLDTPSSPVAVFETQVLENRNKKNQPKPTGHKSPTTSVTNVTLYNRDASVKAWVLEEANGICECCQQSAPFIKTDGFPYLEVHHVRQLADGGTDTTTNAVAICPNCHSEFHYGQNAQALVEKLYERVARLVKE